LLTSNFDFVAMTMVGNIGWLDTPMPLLGVIAGFGLIGSSLFIASQYEKVKIPKWFRAVALVSAAAAVFIMVTFLYLLSEPPGRQETIGLQGRYFIPILIILIPALLAGRRVFTLEHYRALNRRCLKGAVVLLGVMTYIIAVRYYNVGLLAKTITHISLIRF